MRSGVGLVEILIGMALMTAILGSAYGLFRLLFLGSSRASVTGLSRRSALQKDSKSGTRRLIYRLREAIQILSPEAGRSADQLIFRDVTNVEVRIRRAPDGNRVLSERREDGAWVVESDPVMVETANGSLPASWPVAVGSCRAIRFHALTPDCVTVHATLEWEGQLAGLLTVIKLRNSGMSP